MTRVVHNNDHVRLFLPPGEMQFGRLVETLLDRAVASGMKPQIIVVLVSINGYVRAVRYHMKHANAWEGTELVEGDEPPGQFPVNFRFCDAEGQSLLVRVNDSSGMPTMIQ